jgi:hypothetical protein
LQREPTRRAHELAHHREHVRARAERRLAIVHAIATRLDGRDTSYPHAVRGNDEPSRCQPFPDRKVFALDCIEPL